VPRLDKVLTSNPIKGMRSANSRKSHRRFDRRSRWVCAVGNASLWL